MSNCNWVKVDLEIAGQLHTSRTVRSSQIEAVVSLFKATGRLSQKEYAIFRYRKSKANSFINHLKEKKKIVRDKRSFDIFELKRLRDKGLSWVNIALQLYSNERTLRTYFKEHQNELNHDTENNI